MNKTTPAVRDILGALVGEEMLGTRKVADPTRIISKKFHVTTNTARRYLQRLGAAGLATISHTPQRSISHVFLPSEKDIPAALAALEPPTPPPRPLHAVSTTTSPMPVPALEQVQDLPRPRKARASPTPTTDATAVLVDVDNVVIEFKKKRQTVSFTKLKEYLRSTLGIIGFCDAFIGPRSDQGLIATLWDAGFDVVACPMGSKDKDAVDEKMRLRALKYLLTTGIGRIAIVSRDSDFRPLTSVAADHGKTTTLVDITPVMDTLAGTNAPVIASYSRPMERFLGALDRARGLMPGTERDTDRKFVVHTASLVRLDFRESHGDRHPSAISGRTRQRLLKKWSPQYLAPDIETTVKALLESGALKRNGPSGLRLNEKDPLWKHVP